MAASTLCRYGESWVIAAGRIAWSVVRPYIGGYVEPHLAWKIDETGPIAPERAASCERSIERQHTKEHSLEEPGSPLRSRSRSHSVPDITFPASQATPAALASCESPAQPANSSGRRASLYTVPSFLKLQQQQRTKEPMQRSSSSSTVRLLAQARAMSKPTNTSSRPKKDSQRPSVSSQPTTPRAAPVTSALHAMEKLTSMSSQGIQRQWHALARALPPSMRLAHDRLEARSVSLNPSSGAAPQLLVLTGHMSEDDAYSSNSEKIVV